MLAGYQDSNERIEQMIKQHNVLLEKFSKKGKKQKENATNEHDTDYDKTSPLEGSPRFRIKQREK
jgi:hypothetical protein